MKMAEPMQCRALALLIGKFENSRQRFEDRSLECYRNYVIVRIPIEKLIDEQIPQHKGRSIQLDLRQQPFVQVEDGRDEALAKLKREAVVPEKPGKPLLAAWAEDEPQSLFELLRGIPPPEIAGTLKQGGGQLELTQRIDRSVELLRPVPLLSRSSSALSTTA